MAIKLVNKTGAEVKRGDKAVDFHGESYVVTNWEHPHHSASTGCVYVKNVGGMFERGYFPSVFDMAFIEKGQVQVLIDAQYGVYIPQMFSKIYLEDARWVGADETEINILLVGPNHPLYWDAWSQVNDSARYYDKDGCEWQLWLDGDLVCYTGNGEMFT